MHNSKPSVPSAMEITLGKERFPQISPTVCFPCKVRKKKCDKALPGCSRCTRLEVRCRYESLESPDSFHYHHACQRPMKVSSDNYAANPKDHNLNLFPELVANIASIKTQTGIILPPGENHAGNTDDQLTAQICDIIRRNGDDIDISCSMYFARIHDWCQIIMKQRFFGMLAMMRIVPNADFSCLVFTMYLTTLMYEESSARIDDIDQIYDTAKRIHAMLLSSGRASIELVQAGLLIAIYEHSQALHDAAYQTIGGCARMGYILGFHETLSTEFRCEDRENSVAESQRMVWWGIIILERISMLEYLDKKFPFAIPTPLPSDLLPLENGMREPASHGLKLYKVAHDKRSSGLSVQARIAQSAFLLSHVIDYMRASDPKSTLFGAACLDKSLRMFMMMILEENIANNQGPYTICLSALLMLNRYQFSIEPRDEGDDHGSFYRSRAALGVQSVLRMVLDGTQQCSNFTDQHVDSAPVWGIHRIFKATMLYLELGNKEEDKEEWATSLPLAKSLLKSLTPRWRIAGQYLKTIEEAELYQAQNHRC